MCCQPPFNPADSEVFPMVQSNELFRNIVPIPNAFNSKTSYHPKHLTGDSTSERSHSNEPIQHPKSPNQQSSRETFSTNTAINRLKTATENCDTYLIAQWVNADCRSNFENNSYVRHSLNFTSRLIIRNPNPRGSIRSNFSGPCAASPSHPLHVS